MRTEEFTFDVGAERLTATRIISRSGKPPSVVSFHGYGASATRARIRYLLDYLAAHGLSSICFDFSGNGESTGQLEQSNLRVRRDESLAAAALIMGQEPITIIGTSMGAHLAALVSPIVEPRSLVLFCPAAYVESVSELKFGESFVRFENRLASPQGNEDSPALLALRMFKGNLLIVAATEDKVIPRSTVDLYVAAAPSARKKNVMWLAGCEHLVHPWLEQHEPERTAVLEAVLSTIVDE